MWLLRGLGKALIEVVEHVHAKSETLNSMRTSAPVPGPRGRDDDSGMRTAAPVSAPRGRDDNGGMRTSAPVLGPHGRGDGDALSGLPQREPPRESADRATGAVLVSMSSETKAMVQDLLGSLRLTDYSVEHSHQAVGDGHGAAGVLQVRWRSA